MKTRLLLPIVTIQALMLACGMGIAAPTGEPTNAKEAARQQNEKPAISAEMLASEARRKAGMTPEQLAWEETLEANLGNFYLPAYYRDKDANRATAWDYVKDDNALPRLLIIGDSISRGYTLAVRRELTGKVNVHRAPANCGPTRAGLANLQVWLGDGRWNVITWNFGIHDRGTPPAIYQQNLEALLARLKKTGAKIIWVRTTPAPASGVSNEHFTDAQCDLLNQVADEVMKANSIPEIDLFQIAKPKLAEIQLPNNVHFKEAGYDLMGSEVAKGVLSALEKSPASHGEGNPLRAMEVPKKSP